jgi:RNA polymerase sigma factor (sigma-70 family)
VDEAPVAALDPEEAALRAELFEKLDRYRAELSPQEAEVLDAREVRGLSFQEIGDALGLDKSTVFNIHKRAVQKLRDLADASERGTKLARGA